MKIVLDANVAIEVILSRKQRDLFVSVLAQAESVLAPDLLFPEVANGVWKLHEFEKLSVETCGRALRALPDLVDTIVPTRELFHDAFALSRVAHKPAYDMFYLALARREDAVLLTLDAALKKEAKRQGIRVG